MERERFDDLLARYEEGLASCEELAELATGLDLSAAFRRELVARNRIETGLHEWSATRAVAARPSVRAAAERHARSRRRELSHPRAPQWRMGLALAALITLALLGVRHFYSVEPAMPALSIATLESVTGTVSVMRGSLREPARNGSGLSGGEGLLTEKGARASMRFADGTTIALSGDSVSRVWLRAPANSAGTPWKQMTLDVGRLEASVAPQPLSAPMIINTAHSEIKILGTQFTLEATSSMARVEVREGRVQMKRTGDGKAVEVGGGFFAVASRDVELASRPITAVPFAGTPAVSRSLFNGRDLSGWNILRGAWKVENGVVTGNGLEGKFARIESTDSFISGDLVCKLRVTGSRVAEVQFGGYRTFFPVHWETPGWKELQVRVRGTEFLGTLDGKPLQLVQGGSGDEHTLGLLTFYATAHSTLEIKDAHWTDSKP